MIKWEDGEKISKLFNSIAKDDHVSYEFYAKEKKYLKRRGVKGLKVLIDMRRNSYI